MRNHRRLRAAASAPAALMLLGLAGCGGADDLPREAVSGSVSIDDKPLAAGNISFLPLGEDAVTQGGGPIQEGAYSIPRGQGLVPGKYKVVISARAGAERKVDKVESDMPGKVPKFAKESIPPQYNARSTLTAGGHNVFPFALTSQAGKPPKR